MRRAVRESVLGLLSEQSSLSHPRIGDLWHDICAGCDLGIGTLALPGRRERRRGLRRSACLLRDVRVVIAYPAVLLVAALIATARAWWPV